MTAIVVTDLHLDERPANEYRWGILEWLKKQIKEHQANYLLILGDVTDKPDGHSAQMTNRLADGLADLADIARVGLVWLEGNHDCKDPATPFFRFVRHHPRIRYVIEARSLSLRLFGDQSTKTLWLPHTRDPQRDLEGWPCREYEYLFLHVTVDGAAGENGTLLSSPVSRNEFKDVK